MVTPCTRDLDDYTQQYFQLPFEPIQAAYRRKVVLAQIARLRPASLLEVGCGHLPLFTDLPNLTVTVVEPAPLFAAHARSLAATHGNTTVVEGLLEEQTAQLGRFDCIVISCLLHEVPDPQQLLAAARQLCTPQTVLHVSVPNAHSVHRLLAVAMGLIDAPAERSDTQIRMQQRATYDSQTLQLELQQAGFEVMESGSLFIKPFTHAQMQGLVDQNFLTSQVLDGLDQLAKLMPEHGSEIWCNARCCDA